MNAMERIQRLSEFWSWLPVFRVVAETSHLGAAANVLHVSPSALSRSIRLLERQVGHSLFDRVGRGIRLNAQGERFLASVRDAMRLVDDGLRDLTSSDLRLRLSVSSLLTRWLVAPALSRFRASCPEATPIVSDEPDGAIYGMLLRGEIDIGVLERPDPHPRVATEALGEFSSGIFCSRRHPLWAEKRPTWKAVLRHRFVAPEPRTLEVWRDSWPPDRPRQVALRASPAHFGPELCEDGALLAYLPDPLGRASRLRRIPLRVAPRTLLYAAFRPQLGPARHVSELVAALRETITSRDPE